MPCSDKASWRASDASEARASARSLALSATVARHRAAAKALFDVACCSANKESFAACAANDAASARLVRSSFASFVPSWCEQRHLALNRSSRCLSPASSCNLCDNAQHLDRTSSSDPFIASRDVRQRSNCSWASVSCDASSATVPSSVSLVKVVTGGRAGVAGGSCAFRAVRKSSASLRAASRSASASDNLLRKSRASRARANSAAPSRLAACCNSEAFRMSVCARSCNARAFSIASAAFASLSLMEASLRSKEARRFVSFSLLAFAVLKAASAWSARSNSALVASELCWDALRRVWACAKSCFDCVSCARSSFSVFDKSSRAFAVEAKAALSVAAVPRNRFSSSTAALLATTAAWRAASFAFETDSSVLSRASSAADSLRALCKISASLAFASASRRRRSASWDAACDASVPGDTGVAVDSRNVASSASFDSSNLRAWADWAS
mmetsp:Transcript_3721/g.11418  ORF Transcript_3721/g.11418 Transcript_3721/m.11418 type:complete len:444 (-) Transcript_3721:179-1510(-)